MARCHRAAFPNALSSLMGQKYVEKMLEWHVVDDRAFIFFLKENNKCIGYCGGLIYDGKSPIGSASSMIQHSYNAAVMAMLLRPWLFVHPKFLIKYRLVFRNIWRRARKQLGYPQKVGPPPASIPPHTGLIVIGVDPTFQGKGYGGVLLQEFERKSKEMGFDHLMLTVQTDNHQAIKSYCRNGWLTTIVEGNSTTMEKKIKIK